MTITLPGRALRRVVCALAGLTAALASQPSCAQDRAKDGFPEIRIAPGTPAPTDGALAALLERLRGLAARKDKAGVEALVAKNFRWDRDLGGGYEPTLSAAQNLVAALQLDDSQLAEEYQGVGWRHFARMLQARSMGHGGRPGEVCAPQEPQYRTATDQKRAYATDGLHYEYGYVEASGVAVRAAPSLDAPVLDRVSSEAVKVPDWTATAEPMAEWIEVATARGARGYLATRFVESFIIDRVCFGRIENGEWRITAYVGGGD